MAVFAEDPTIEDLYERGEIKARAYKALDSEGFCYISELRSSSDEELGAVSGIGPATLAELRVIIDRYDYSRAPVQRSISRKQVVGAISVAVVIAGLYLVTRGPNLEPHHVSIAGNKVQMVPAANLSNPERSCARIEQVYRTLGGLEKTVIAHNLPQCWYGWRVWFQTRKWW